METKRCYRCGVEKPLTEFHKHKRMPHGRRNICKECACREERERQYRLSQDPSYYDRERQRGRDKYRRLYADKHEKSSHKENKTTRRDIKAMGINVDGYEVHHWDYNQKKDVFLLTPRAHKRVHSYLTFDDDSKKFMCNGVLLETKDEHMRVILSILSLYGDVEVQKECFAHVVRILSKI